VREPDGHKRNAAKGSYPTLAARIADRILGAKIVAFGENGDGTVTLDFEHRGTDDDSGSIRVPLTEIRFEADRA
jgi:hypothetical protein